MTIAATQALRRAGYQFVSQTLAHCLTEPEAAADQGYSPEDIQASLIEAGWDEQAISEVFKEVGF